MRAALEAEQGNIPTQENNVDGRTIVGQKPQTEPQTEVRRSGQSTNEMIQSAARQAGNR